MSVDEHDLHRWADDGGAVPPEPCPAWCDRRRLACYVPRDCEKCGRRFEAFTATPDAGGPRTCYECRLHECRGECRRYRAVLETVRDFGVSAAGLRRLAEEALGGTPPDRRAGP